MNSSEPWRNQRRVIEMCLELALVSQDKTSAQDKASATGDEGLADEMAARIFAMAELCRCMGWTQSSRLLREARLELLNESGEDD
jgi:hypothetical protein